MAKITHLTETHDMTLEQADALLGEIAETTLSIRRAEVAGERKVQTIQAEVADKTKADRARLAELEGRLQAFVVGHRMAFRKPRMRATTHGKYGLESSTRTVFDAVAKTLAWLKRNGHRDAIKTTEKPVGKLVTKLLKDGTSIPGVSLITGEIYKYQLDPAILDEL